MLLLWTTISIRFSVHLKGQKLSKTATHLLVPCSVAASLPLKDSPYSLFPHIKSHLLSPYHPHLVPPHEVTAPITSTTHLSQCDPLLVQAPRNDHTLPHSPRKIVCSGSSMLLPIIDGIVKITHGAVYQFKTNGCKNKSQTWRIGCTKNTVFKNK